MTAESVSSQQEKPADMPSTPDSKRSNDEGVTTVQKEDEETKYPPFRTVALVMLALYLAIFLVALVLVPPYLMIQS